MGTTEVVWDSYGRATDHYYGFRRRVCIGSCSGRSSRLISGSTCNSLAVTARIWSYNPFVSHEEFSQRTIGVPSQVVAILWMGLSATVDGIVTVVLLFCFSKAKSETTFDGTSSLIKKLMGLTMSTVLLTHLCGAAMCVLFLSAPAAHRTKSDPFWVLLEIVTELYALSLLFTINSRSAVRKTFEGTRVEEGLNDVDLEVKQEDQVPKQGKEINLADSSATLNWLDRQVEGPQGGPSLLVEMPALSYHSRSSDESGSGSSAMRLAPMKRMERLGSAQTEQTSSSRSSEHRPGMEVRYDLPIRPILSPDREMNFMEFLETAGQESEVTGGERRRSSLAHMLMNRKSSSGSSDIYERQRAG